jgi:predicted nucleotidyltransferase component of viral defense system
MSRKINRNHYIIKGGCNLRFFFKSPRYSEDIDLDVKEIPVQILQEQVNKILKSSTFRDTIFLKGIRIRHITSHKQTETTQRWKLTLLSGQSQIPIPTRIEFSRRQKEGAYKFETVDTLLLKKYDLPLVLVNHYTPEAAFVQKIEAISFRRIPQARDIFDLYILINSGIDVHSVLKNLSKNNIINARTNIFAVSFNTFKGQVLSYLSPDNREIYGSEEVWDSIRLKVIDAMEGGVK